MTKSCWKNLRRQRRSLLEETLTLMRTPPAWAKRLPVEAEGFISPRYSGKHEGGHLWVGTMIVIRMKMSFRIC